MPLDNEIHITDFRLAGYLVARGVLFKGTSTNDRGDVVFTFDNSPNSEGRTAHEILNLYPGSTEQRYDAACKTMHDFVKVQQMNARRRSPSNNG